MAKKDDEKKDALIKKNEEIAKYDYGDHLGAGFEDTTTEDFAMPFLGILQDLSPAVKDGTVEGAEIGMFINSATNELYDGQKGIRAIPCFRQRKFIEWIERKKGGGYVGEYSPEDPVVKKAKDESIEFGKFKIGDNDLVETYLAYWILLAEDRDEPIGQVVTSFKSMNIKKYKNFMTTANQIRIQGKPAPIFAHVYRLKTVSETKPGGTFFNWDIRLDGKDALSCRINPESDMFKAALSLHEMARDGKAKVDHTKETHDGDESPEDQKQY